MICEMLYLRMNQSSSIYLYKSLYSLSPYNQFQKMPGFTKDILGKRVSRIDLYQIFHDEDTWFFNICVIKLKHAYSTLLLNIYKETDKQKHQYNCLSWTGCFFHKHCFFLNKQQEDKFLLFRHIYLYLADIFSKINEVSLSLQKKILRAFVTSE